MFFPADVPLSFRPQTETETVTQRQQRQRQRKQRPRQRKRDRCRDGEIPEKVLLSYRSHRDRKKDRQKQK